MQVEQELLLDLHTGRRVTESDYTRCCINTTDLLMKTRCLLETCKGLKQTYYIKEMCVKLVTYQELTNLRYFYRSIKHLIHTTPINIVTYTHYVMVTAQQA